LKPGPVPPKHEPTTPFCVTLPHEGNVIGLGGDP
jgi:hypothetical protein